MDAAALWTGVVLIAAGSLALAWGLRGEGPRGRRRCAKCWYDMRGVPGLTCPECGRTMGSERELARRRRRWGVVRLGVLMAVLGYPLLRVGEVRRDGWGALPPRAALVLAARFFPDEGEAVLIAQMNPAQVGARGALRMMGGQSADLLVATGVLPAPTRPERWERVLLAQQCRRVLREHMGGRPIRVGGVVVSGRHVQDLAEVLEGEAALLLPEVMMLLRAESEWDRALGLTLLRRCRGAAGAGVRRELGRIAREDPTPRIRGMAGVTLVELFPKSRRAAAGAAVLLKDPDPWVRYTAADVLARFGAAATGELPVLRTMIEKEEDAWTRAAAEKAVRTIEGAAGR